MQSFDVHKGIAAPLLRDNIDTDAIIPSREMNRVSKEGLGVGLFAQWRYVAGLDGRIDDDGFILNQERFRGATILLGGENFGCGSSREHAVWALRDFGIRCVIAPSFGAIFYSNCLSNGVLPVRLERSDISAIAQVSAAQDVTVDLRQREVRADTLMFAFVIDTRDRERLLQGVDDIDQTLTYAEELKTFKERDAGQRPWVAL
ncbi:MAG: 3-isopropylmalate dehydratase small subunit [Gammaproteobacteria bacterium]